MTDLLIIVPSRGRPGAVREMAQAFGDTVRGGVRLVFAVEPDQYAAYAADMEAAGYSASGRAVCLMTTESRSMVEALNNAVRALEGEAYAIGFMGDDHRPRTVGWDVAYLDALRQLGTGLVFGNDLVQSQNLPTQVAMTADIVRALGWMAPPVLRHMYVDNFWRDLGVHAGCIRYLPDVVVEHLHPVVGTAEWDEGYRRVNAEHVYAEDAEAYTEFQRTGAFKAAVEAVRALLPADPKLARMIANTRASMVAEAAYLTKAHTVADIAKEPTGVERLLGPALQVRHSVEEMPADIVCATDLEGVQHLAGAAAVAAGVPLEEGFTMVRSKTLDGYTLALGVRL